MRGSQLRSLIYKGVLENVRTRGKARNWEIIGIHRLKIATK